MFRQPKRARRKSGASDVMPRREFLSASAIVVGGTALTVVGCAQKTLPAAATPVADATLYRLSLDEAPELRQTEGVHRVTTDGFDIFLVRKSASDIVALKNTCTHESCPTKYDAASKEFACPCHQSRFNLDGVPTRGPAKTPLQRYAATLKNNAIEVALTP